MNRMGHPSTGIVMLLAAPAICGDGGGSNCSRDQPEGQPERLFRGIPDVVEALDAGITGQESEPAQRDRAHGEGEEAGQDHHAARRETAKQLEHSRGKRQDRGRDEHRGRRSRLPLLRHDEGVRQDEFLDSPGKVDQQQHPRHVPHPRVERQGQAEGERDPGHHDQPARQRMPRRRGLRQGSEPDPRQLGRDDHSRRQLDEGDRGLGEAHGAGCELADGDLRRGGAEQITWDEDEQSWDHEQHRPARGILGVQDLEGDDRYDQRADDGQQQAQAADPVRGDEHHAHDRAEKGRSRHLAPALLHTGSEADREQGHTDDAKPPRVRVAAGL
jgi:hypothetical protein